MSASDHLNPVTLKELRQMVRSKLVAAGLIGFLVVELIGVALVLLGSREELRHGVALSEQGLGEDVFQTVYFVLTVLLLFCVPFYVGVRMGAERGGEHLDLQYTTALRPRQFVDGKTAAAVVLILLFAGAALPFLALSYLLRGLDVFQAMVATAMLIMVAVGCIYEALFLAAVTASRVFRVIILLAALVFHFILVGMVSAGGAAMVSYSHVSLATWPDCVWPALFVGACVSACLLLRAVTTTLIMPPPANRAPPVRFWITGLWFVWGAVAATAAWVETDIDYLYVWSLVSIVIAAILSGISASFAPGYSRRVLGEISARAWARPRQFLFFSGAENGMVWALLLGAASVLVVAAAERIGPVGWRAPALVATAPAITGPTGWHAPLTDEPGASQLAGFFLYLTAYVWSVRAVWQIGFRRWVTYRLAGVVAGVLVILGWALPALMALGNEKGGDEAAWLFGNAFAVFSLFEEEPLKAVAMARAAGVWAALAVAANLPGLLAAARRFVPTRVLRGGSEVGPSETSGPTAHALGGGGERASADAAAVARDVPDRVALRPVETTGLAAHETSDAAAVARAPRGGSEVRPSETSGPTAGASDGGGGRASADAAVAARAWREGAEVRPSETSGPTAGALGEGGGRASAGTAAVARDVPDRVALRPAETVGPTAHAPNERGSGVVRGGAESDAYG